MPPDETLELLKSHDEGADRHLAGVTAGLVCGLAVGAAIGLLLAPRPGPGRRWVEPLLHPRHATDVIRQRGVRGLLDLLRANRGLPAE